ncbi:hypothetical protein BCR39DRAFT_71841 [Naematelia encephala]|uniref:Uncharacterized protein n=1 Tax=Naematelia encephala TaxID=71784 RepID=A0A1Y2BBY1_9TREE|nr:hypothetical protein BCR39DRAFT_71841 [Naematelia encephala]
MTGYSLYRATTQFSHGMVQTLPSTVHGGTIMYANTRVPLSIDTTDTDFDFDLSKGIYGVSLDNGQAQYYAGFSADAQFQAVLYASSGLTEGDHTLRLSNENGQNIAQYPQYIYLDVDEIAVTGTLLNAASATSDSSIISSTETTMAVLQTSQVASTSTSTQPTSTISSTTPSSSSSSSSSSIFTSSSAPTSTSTSTLTSATSPSLIPTSSTLASSSTPTTALSTPPPPISSIIIHPNTLVPSFATNKSEDSTTMETTGTPNVSAPLTSPPKVSSGVVGTAVGADGTGSSSHKTTTIAVSVTVIIIAVAVMVTIGSLYYWRTRRKKLDRDEQAFRGNGGRGRGGVPKSRWSEL